MLLRIALFMGLMTAAGPLCARETEPVPPTVQQRPNFLVIVADDLGFSDLGAFGGEISTPHLDALAKKGVRLANFHTAATCSPTRSMLLSGTDNHLAGLGTMAEVMQPNQRGAPGYEGYLRPDIASIGEIFSAGGYRTVFSGKWHLGVAPENDPHSRGFQQSFALLQGGHNHFGLGPSLTRGTRSNYSDNGSLVATVGKDFYSSDAFADALLGKLAASKSDRKDKRPFFAYLAFTAPHWPLQAPAETIAKYRGRYDKGFEVLRAERMKRQISLGLLDAKAVPHELAGTTRRWAALSEDEKRTSARSMEIYAAMVDRMDQNVGKVLKALKKAGELENTVILFMADNGAEGSELLPAAAAAYAAGPIDSSYEKMGSASSFVTYGQGWAQAATAPSWLYKAYSSEGGIRAPAFLVAPSASRQGGIATAYTNVMDILPTFADMAGIPLPKGSLWGRQVQAVRGLSWAAWLDGSANQVYPADKPVGSELFGSRALHQGDWKITDTGDGQWKLFNLASDPGETQDLSAAEPARKDAMISEWQAYAGGVNIVMPGKP